MRQDLISINMIVDSSGSMANTINDTLGGFNKFLSDQKEFPGEALLTLCTFSNSSNFVHLFKPIKEVEDLTKYSYVPGGNTALLDAIGETIAHVEAHINLLPEETRPGKVIFVILTDGEENASRKYKLAEIKNKITALQAKNYEFIFMGANIDSISEGKNIGIVAGNTRNFSADSRGTRALYDSLSSNMSSYRNSGSNASTGNFWNQPAVHLIQDNKPVPAVDASTPIDLNLDLDSKK